MSMKVPGHVSRSMPYSNVGKGKQKVKKLSNDRLLHKIQKQNLKKMELHEKKCAKQFSEHAFTHQEGTPLDAMLFAILFLSGTR